ncbi:MAG: hypothetical protein ACFCD0_10695 [Gemmataceae bacterium]
MEIAHCLYRNFDVREGNAVKVHILKWCLAVVCGVLLVPDVFAQRETDGQSEAQRIFRKISRGKDRINVSSLWWTGAARREWSKKNGNAQEMTEAQFSRFYVAWKKERERRKGLSPSQQAAYEFKDRDGNGDGRLDAREMRGQFGRDEFLKKYNIRDGKMTQSQFVRYRIEQNQFWKTYKKGLKGSVDSLVSKYLKKYDKNRDGVLERSEMGSVLRTYYERFKFDKNRDGRLDRSELANWFQANQKHHKVRSTKSSERGSSRAIQRIIIPELLDERPPVFAFGKMPEETPDWFTDNDGDKDGQIGLYEWRKSGKSVKEFFEIDSNRDGFIAPDEMIRAQERAVEAASAEGSSSSSNRRARR